MKYWLQRDAHSPAEGPLSKMEVLALLKGRVISAEAVVNVAGQPRWMRVGDVFARELRKWKWERFMVKGTFMLLGALALVITAWVLIQNAVNHYNTPEAEAERYQAQRETVLREVEQQRMRHARREAEMVPVDRWEAVAKVFETAGARVIRDGDRGHMRVVVSVALAEQLSEYQLKTLAQAAYSRLGDNCIVTVEDEFGAKLSKAWAWGASSSK
jgi:hypothetical protein